MTSKTKQTQMFFDAIANTDHEKVQGLKFQSHRVSTQPAQQIHIFDI
jgi:hypothetical protein